MSSFGSSGGLGEAAAWLTLRQDIYISLVWQTPLKTHLENFHSSEVFCKDLDTAWANKIVFLLGRLLATAWRTSGTSIESIGSIERDLDHWLGTKPAAFDPLTSMPPNRSNRLPRILMLSAVHAFGLQYYHMARVVILSSRVKRQAFDTKDFTAQEHDHSIRDHLLIILGLAKWNQKAENLLYTARHSLSACKFWFCISFVTLD